MYPLGNGRLGCTVFGDPRRERIQFNEDSLWVGNEDFTGGYQPFGDIYVETPHAEYSDCGDTSKFWWWQVHLKQPDRLLGSREYASDQNIDLDLEAQVRVLHARDFFSSK